MPRNSLIDEDFEEVGDNLPDFGEDSTEGLSEAQKHLNAKLPSEADIEVVVKDDTPDEDRGRPTADNLEDKDEPEDEAQSYSKRVQERIKRETAKVHAERRAKEDRERQLSEAANYIKNLIRENSQLKDMVESGEKVLISEHTGRLRSDIERAEAAYREAHEAGDVNGQLAAQRAIASATAKLTQAETHVSRPLPRTQESEAERFYRQQPVVTPDPKASDWAQRNPWFQRDEVMTFVAMDTHKRLVSSGVLPDTDEYYRQIDAEVRRRFPERFKSSQTQQPSGQPRRSQSVVAPVARGSGPTARTKVTLTETQVRLARRLGLTPEQYASQIVAESSGSGEWVHGKSS